MFIEKEKASLAIIREGLTNEPFAEPTPKNNVNIKHNRIQAYVSKGTLYVSGLTEGINLNIYAITGALVYSRTVTREVMEIDMLPIGFGVYIVESRGEAVKIAHVP